MKKVLVNVPFRDRYSGKLYAAGITYKMTEERIAEIKEVNPNLISVVGNVKSEKPTEEKPTEEEPEGEDGKA